MYAQNLFQKNSLGFLIFAQRDTIKLGKFIQRKESKIYSIYFRFHRKCVDEN